MRRAQGYGGIEESPGNESLARANAAEVDDRIERGPKDQINIGILQATVSGIPLLLHLTTSTQDPPAYVVFGDPSGQLEIFLVLDPVSDMLATCDVFACPSEGLQLYGSLLKKGSYSRVFV